MPTDPSHPRADATPTHATPTNATPDVRRTVALNRALLATAPGREKLTLILDQPDPKKFVRSLPGEDLFFALKEIGLDDAAEVVGLTTPTQFRTFVDIDAWERDTLLPERVLGWLRLAWEGRMGEDAFRAQRAGLDPEVVLHLLRKVGTVHAMDEDGDYPNVMGDNFIRTAEGKYIFEISVEGDDGVMARRIIEDFIDENPFEATRLFEAVRWELDSELEENCLRWRTGRMRDIGFPDLEEALKVWTPLPASWKPRDAAPAHGPVSGVPALLLATTRADLLLDRAAERLADEHRPAFNEGLVYLLNCALVADGIDPKDLDLARASLAGTRDTLSLGLELASEGDVALAAGILATTPAHELFRRAVTELLELQKQANFSGKSVAFGAGPAANVDSPDAEVLTGLRRRRPRLYDPPTAGQKRPEGAFRALRDRADVLHVRTVLARVDARRALADAAGLTPERFAAIADAAGRTTTATSMDQALRTALVHALLDGAPRFEALTTDDAARISAVFASNSWPERIRTAAAPWIARVPAAAGLVEGWIAPLEDGLATPARAGTIDPKFVEVVLFAG